MARSLLKLLAEPYWLGNQELSVTPSIGIALFPDDGEDFESLYRCADTAMYRAKGEGRNRFAFFTPEMQSTSMRRLQLENALRKATDRQELQLHFQPQVDMTNNRLLGAEVLLRWQHPEWRRGNNTYRSADSSTCFGRSLASSLPEMRRTSWPIPSSHSPNPIAPRR